MFHIPIKGDGNIVLATTTKDLYLGLAVLFAYVFLDGDTAKSFKLRASAKAATDKLKKLVGSIVHLVSISRHSRLNELFGWGSSGRLLADYGTHMIERLFEVGKSEEEIVAEILPTAAASVATQAQAMAQMIDVYLEDEYKHHWPEIRRCAYSDEEEDFETLKKYALEGCRLAPAAFGLLRLTQEDGKIEDGEGKPVEYHRGDLLYTDFVAAGRDSNVFPNPDMIDVHRDSNLYIHQGMGPHSCLGRDITEISLAVQLGLFARLKNLRRMPGQAGKLKYTTNLPGGNPGAIRVYMTEDWNSWFPFPTSKFSSPTLNANGAADVFSSLQP